MKTNKKIRYVTLVTFASLLAPFASAQVSGAVNAATRANAATSAATQNAAINAQQGLDAATRADAANMAATNAAQVSNNATSGAVNANAAGAAEMQADRPLREGVGVNSAANANASATGQTNGLSIANAVSGGAATSLDVSAMVHEIHGATQATRATVLSQVDHNIDATAHVVADLRHSGRQLKGEARAQFDAAYDGARAQEKAVKRSLHEARKAKDETWDDAQAKLAADYEAYGQAVARVEASTQGSMTTTSSTSR